LDSAFTNHKSACHRALDQLIKQAVQEKKQSLKELTLAPHHQTLLALDTPNSSTLRIADKLLWAMQLSFDGTVEALKQHHAHIEQQQHIFRNSSTSRWGFLKTSCRTENSPVGTHAPEKTTHNAQPIF
jgi:hypothetical protein